MRGFPLSAEDALAVWEGRKTVHRVPMKEIHPSFELITFDGEEAVFSRSLVSGRTQKATRKPPYSPGEVVYMQEPWGAIDLDSGYALAQHPKSLDGIEIVYEAGCSDFIDSLIHTWFSPVTMPFKASRLHLRLTVRPDRLWEITGDDFEYEGITGESHASPVRGQPYEIYRNGDGMEYGEPLSAFMEMWDSRYGKKYPYSSNPHVWRYGLEEVWRR